MHQLKRLYYIYFGGTHKNQHFPYMLHGLLMLLMPNALYRYLLRKKFKIGWTITAGWKKEPR